MPGKTFSKAIRASKQSKHLPNTLCGGDREALKNKLSNIHLFDGCWFRYYLITEHCTSQTMYVVTYIAQHK